MQLLQKKIVLPMSLQANARKNKDDSALRISPFPSASQNKKLDTMPVVKRTYAFCQKQVYYS